MRWKKFQDLLSSFTLRNRNVTIENGKKGSRMDAMKIQRFCCGMFILL